MGYAKCIYQPLSKQRKPGGKYSLKEREVQNLFDSEKAVHTLY